MIARNDHTTRFEPRDCDLRQLSYVNVGGILAWRFEDRVEFDWGRHTIDYRGRDGERRYEFAGETFVDKLSQYEAIACRLRAGASDFTLNYVDDRIARYRFVVDGEEVVESPAGTFRTVRLVAGPGADGARAAGLPWQGDVLARAGTRLLPGADSRVFPPAVPDRPRTQDGRTGDGAARVRGVPKSPSS